MNKKANEQFKSNEKRMLNIFAELLEKKDIRKITVREICEIAQVNRSTFYNHFLDVYDMLDKLMKSHLDMMAEIFPNGSLESPKDNLRAILEYMKKHKTLYRASFHSAGYDKMITGFEVIFKHHEVENYEGLSELEKRKIDYVVYFVEQGLFSTISYWLDHDCDVDVEIVLDVINQFYTLDDKNQIFNV